MFIDSSDSSFGASQTTSNLKYNVAICCSWFHLVHTPFFFTSDVDKFRAFKVQKTWFEARESCIQTGGDLFYLKKDDLPISNIRGLAKVALDAANITSGDSFHIGAVHRHWIWPSKIVYA